jgi:SAM-dependent methyltransferase
MASRRGALIDGHVAWLSALVPDGRRVLDLGCGPGLYLERFAQAGWHGVGIDVSPAAIDHGVSRTRELGVECTYLLGDLRSTSLSGGFDLVLCLFGELSTFPIEDVRGVVDSVTSHLNDRGRIVIELSTRAGLAGKASRPVSWYTANGGLLADGPHVVLRESHWFESEGASVERWWVLDELSSQPRMFGSTTWWHYDIDRAISGAGLVVDGRFADLAGAPHAEGSEFETLVLRRV